MSEAIWAALIGAIATIVATVLGTVIQTYLRDRSAVSGIKDKPIPQPAAVPLGSCGDSVVAPPQSGSTGLPSAPPPDSDGSLTAEEAITWLESQGGRRGATATPGGSYYSTVSRLRFVRCTCAWQDTSYGCHEFIARTSRGSCYYIGLSRSRGMITCGPKGYHWYHPEVPECIAGRQ